MVVLDQDDDTRDLAADASGLRLAKGARAVAVLAVNCIAQQPGEDRRRPTRGVAWDDLLGKGASLVGIRTAITRQVSAVSGVVRVVSCAVNPSPAGPSQAVADLVLATAEGEVAVSAPLG